LGCDPATILSISIVDTDEMVDLNRKFRGQDRPTNVLAFSQIEGEEAGPSMHLLGDVVICADRAREEALELGYTDDEMVLYLLIHGVLHLVGYAHDEPLDSAEMSRRVDEMFAALCPLDDET
jgi:probable rRNA maturation factor